MGTINLLYDPFRFLSPVTFRLGNKKERERKKEKKERKDMESRKKTNIPTFSPIQFPLTLVSFPLSHHSSSYFVPLSPSFSFFFSLSFLLLFSLPLSVFFFFSLSLSLSLSSPSFSENLPIPKKQEDKYSCLVNPLTL